MNCEQTQKNKDDFLDKSLTPEDTLELQRHLHSCAKCREDFQRDEEILYALRNLPVPPPSPDFVKRTFAAARAKHEGKRIKNGIPYLGGAIAACIALWLIVAGPMSQQPPIPHQVQQQAAQAINIKINEQRLVKVVVNAPRDLIAADVVIELPDQLELAGFPGRREIRWNTNLRQGRNLLSLPLVAKSAGSAELITHITHDNKSKMLSLDLEVYNDDLTRKGHNTPTTA